MKPISPGWTRIADPSTGGKAYWDRVAGVYAISSPGKLQVTVQGFRPSLSECKAALSAFDFKDAAEIPTGREIFRRFEKASPMIFGQQIDLFGKSE